MVVKVAVPAGASHEHMPMLTAQWFTQRCFVNTWAIHSRQYTTQWLASSQSVSEQVLWMSMVRCLLM